MNPAKSVPGWKETTRLEIEHRGAGLAALDHLLAIAEESAAAMRDLAEEDHRREQAENPSIATKAPPYCARR